ncbi:hypothetical protein [Burkholderia sola]|uniref:hypothetical protein n=1 Tax=Burkholderia sola TaxID=2843302 RepID=UPI0023DD7633|nr:hypothetical protein [Burkholderia sola]MDF3085921.1 hypothetical protein [Burkholderia sola]
MLAIVSAPCFNAPYDLIKRLIIAIKKRGDAIAAESRPVAGGKVCGDSAPLR